MKKEVSAEEFEDEGWIQEANRQIFHPCARELKVVDGQIKAFKSDDLRGIMYPEDLTDSDDYARRALFVFDEGKKYFYPRMVTHMTFVQKFFIHEMPLDRMIIERLREMVDHLNVLNEEDWLIPGKTKAEIALKSALEIAQEFKERNNDHSNNGTTENGEDSNPPSDVEEGSAGGA